MATLFERIEDAHRDWIAKQALFFVGTAPLGADGHINVSPKGPIGSLRVLDDHTLAYLDACGDRFVHSATYLNCAVDYEGAGSLATVFAEHFGLQPAYAHAVQVGGATGLAMASWSISS